MNFNAIMITAISAVAIISLIALYIMSKSKKEIVAPDEFDSIEKLLELVKRKMVDEVKEDYSLGLTVAEFDRLHKHKTRIREANKGCVSGEEKSRAIIIETIKGFIVDEVPMEQIKLVLGFGEGQTPSNHTMFELILYKVMIQHGKDAFHKWVEKNKFNEPRTIQISDDLNDLAYFISEEDLLKSYEDEMESFIIDDDVIYDIMAIIIYQKYKGFGIIDTLQLMNLNGINFGTSGANLKTTGEKYFINTRSQWVMFEGVQIHLRFMNYDSEDEMERIIQTVVRGGDQSSLTISEGHRVTTMYNKSRVLALRPPVADSWGIFIRKFTLKNVTPEYLFDKPYTKNAQLPINMLRYMMRGMVTTAFTGQQGSGKTTAMTSIIRFISSVWTLRIVELAPELYLRELYPNRNIVSVHETKDVTAWQLQDALKKSDGAVTLVGEVASDTVAANMLQMAQVASLFTIFSHHATTAKDLVYALSNSLVNAANFKDHTAQKQVVDVLKLNIHMDFTADGKRYIERITEIIPLPEGVEYPELDPDNLDLSLANVMREWATRQTDRVQFQTRDIIKYNLETHTYEAVHRMSPALENQIRTNIGPENELCIAFDVYTYNNWNRRPNGEHDVVYEAVERYKQFGYGKEIDGGKFHIENKELHERIDELEEKSEVTGMSKEDISSIEMTLNELEDFLAIDSEID